MAKMTYEVPDVKMSEAEIASPAPNRPSIYIPVNEEIASGIDVDDNVTFTVKGTIKAKRNVESAYSDGTYDIDIELKEIVFDDKNEFSKLVEDDE